MMKGRKKASFWGAVFAAVFMMITGICLPGTQVHAHDIEYARGGVVPVVFVLHSPRRVVVNWDTGDIVNTLGSVSGDVEWSGGSGFFIGDSNENPQYVVTNQHVINDYTSAGEGGQYFQPEGWYQPETYGYVFVQGIVADSCEMRIYYSESEWQTAYVDATGDVSKVDLAVLRLREPTDKRHALELKIPTQDMVGTIKASSIGYPGNADNEYTAASKYGVNDSTVHNGTITRIAADDKGVERLAMDATIQHGNSGGPLITEDGYVIGVNTNVESNSPYYNQIEVDYYAISTNELVRFLDKNSIPYTLASDSELNAAETESDTKDDSSEELDKVSGDLVESADSASLPADKSSDNTMLIIIIAAAAVLVVLIIVVAVLLSKKKKTQTPDAGVTQTAPAPQPAPVPQKKALLRSLSVQHNGMTFAVHSTALMIGRDPTTCKVVFKEGTEGVSGRHCSISFDEASGDFVLTDLRSTYGTFLMNGQKLNSNVPYRLKAGDGFYAGDKANAFRVELG